MADMGLNVGLWASADTGQAEEWMQPSRMTVNRRAKHIQSRSL